MKLKEITIYPSKEENIEDYQYIFNSSEKVKAFSNITFSELEYNDEHHLGLFDVDKLISYLRIDIRIKNMWQVTFSLTSKEFRGQGCFRFLLEKAVKNHHQILSDHRQTIEAKNAWKSLIRYPGIWMQIFIFDQKMGTTLKKASESTPDNEIWNNDDIVLLVQEIVYTKESIEIMEARNNHPGILKVHRDDLSIWYGPNSSNENYINP